MAKQNPISKLISKVIVSPYVDKWTAVHMAAGAFICKIALWCGASDSYAVALVFGIGVTWEVMEWIIEDGWIPYGNRSNWAKNTISDLVVETGLALWMVL